MITKKNLWKLVLVLVMFCWATVFPASKSIVEKVGPLLLAFLRYFVALLFMIPLFLREKSKRDLRIPRRELGGLWLMSMIGVVAFSILLISGIHLSSSVHASILNNGQPISAVFLAPLFIKEDFSKTSMIGAIIGFGGIILIATGGNFSTLSFTSTQLWGDILVILSAIAMTTFNIFMKRYIQLYGSVIATTVAFLFGTAVLFPIIFLAGSPIQTIFSFTPSDIAILLFLGVVSTVIPYLLFNRALIYMPVATAAGFKFLISIFGAVLSVFLLGEKPTLVTIIGAVIVFGALGLIQWERKTIAS